MSETPSRLRKIAWAIAPVWASKFDAWQQRRAKARRQYERELDRLANPEAHIPPEPEPRDVHGRFVRMAGRPREDWRRFADEMAVEQRPLHHRLGRHHRVTRAADNFLRRDR
jgi:dTDP-4-amino-4,6-dideoxygalactose transaminase